MSWIRLRIIISPYFGTLCCKYCTSQCRQTPRKVIKDLHPVAVSKGTTKKKSSEKEFGIKNPSQRNDNVGMQRYLDALGITPEDIERDDPEDFDFDEGMFEETLLSGSNISEEAKMEEKEKRRIIQRKIIRKTYFREPPETNLLTWSAKEQIRFLNQHFPKEWTPEKLAESFPISLEGVKKLLRSKFVKASEERIRKHDQGVLINWENLRNGEGIISPITRKLWLEGKLSPEHASGNKSLPAPIAEPEKRDILCKPTKKEFVSIVKTYMDAKRKAEAKKSANTVMCESRNDHSQISADILQENVISASYLDPKGFRRGLPMTQEQFKKQEEYNSKGKYLPAECQRHVNVQNCNNETNINNSEEKDEFSIKKYDTNYVEFNVDINRETSKKEAYLYTDKHGYQRPFGRADAIQEKVKIPKHKMKRGKQFKVGDCFYDEDGEFLYRVPI